MISNAKVKHALTTLSKAESGLLRGDSGKVNRLLYRNVHKSFTL